MAKISKDYQDTAEQLKLSKQHLKEMSELEKEKLERSREEYSLSRSITEDLKEQLESNKENKEQLRIYYNISKDVSRTIRDTSKDYNKIKDIHKDKSKYEKLSNTIQKEIGNRVDKIREKEQKLLDSRLKNDEKVYKLQQEIKEVENWSLDSKDVKNEKLKELKGKLEEVYQKEKSISSVLTDKDILMVKHLNHIQKQVEELDYQEGIIEEVNEKMGVTGSILEGLSKIPGIGKFLSEGLDEYRKKLIEAKEKNEEISSKFKVMTGLVSLIGTNFMKALMDPSVIIGKIIHSFLELNKASVEFQRLTGDTANLWEANVHPSIISATDYMKELSNLTKQFGVNAQMAFDQINIIEMAEMTKMMGFTADGAGRLARLAQTSDQNLANMNEQIIDAVNNYNRANNVGINHRQILDDVSNASSAIALSLESNPEALAKAAAEARKLGIEMSSLEGIASSILDFESSIAAQLEAELLTGQQINLERARTYALTNDMKSLGEELNNNQQLFNSYVEGNRIQQESIARTLGMSREQMGEMIMQSRLYNDLSKEQREIATGMTTEDMKRLEVQQSINQSIQKMTEALAGPLEALAQVLEHSWAVYGIMITILGVMIAKAAVWASMNPLMAPIGMAAAAATFAGLSIYRSIRESDDLISPGYGERTLTTPEGTYALNDKDTVVAGTDLGVEDTQIRKESSSPTKPPEINFNPLIEEIKGLRNESQEMKELLKAVMERESDILMDGNKVGIALTSGTANYSIQ